MLAFGPEEEGWLLVLDEENSKAGYVPANYVEEVRPVTFNFNITKT